jgi:Zn-dependent protease
VGDLTLQHVVLRIVAALLIAAVHGFAVAATTCALGDPGPRQDERLSLNPIRHLDLIGGLLLVLFGMGWIRPTAVDPVRLRGGRFGLVAVVSVACCATIGLAIAARLIRPPLLNLLPDTQAATCFIFVETLGQLCASFTLFNLLPLPPLTGQHLLVAILPRRRDALRRLQPYIGALLVVLIVSGMATRLLAPAEAVLGRFILGGG